MGGGMPRGEKQREGAGGGGHGSRAGEAAARGNVDPPDPLSPCPPSRPPRAPGPAPGGRGAMPRPSVPITPPLPSPRSALIWDSRWQVGSEGCKGRGRERRLSLWARRRPDLARR
ncbi:hypothetical protein PVAP13_6KG150806 [Panicum virgatum]|uniref:Uncharacterized protein n=1 Tax=Panicum virgatum TaxID=38727 RepID=A0A8T0RDR8_PANVG|nr:hypothetical protein PVAP13_6KG150806 [Panicum virgatum]